MHSLIAGFMGFFMGFGGFFHGGASVPHNANQAQITQQASISGMPRFGRGGKRGFGDDPGRMGLQDDEQRFFGLVTAVNGSTITVQMQGMMWRPSGTITPTITPRVQRTFTITLDSGTAYTGGSATDIVTNTRVAGIARKNSDGSLTAISVQINPTVPTGFPLRGGHMRVNVPEGNDDDR